MRVEIDDEKVTEYLRQVEAGIAQILEYSCREVFRDPDKYRSYEDVQEAIGRIGSQRIGYRLDVFLDRLAREFHPRAVQMKREQSERMVEIFHGVWQQLPFDAADIWPPRSPGAR